MTPTLHAWKLEALRLFTRFAMAYEEADSAQQEELSRTMRPSMTRIKGLLAQAQTDAEARVALLDTVDDAHLIIEKVMGRGWQPHGALATRLRNHSSATAGLLD